jgi:hypothetical protein
MPSLKKFVHVPLPLWQYSYLGEFSSALEAQMPPETIQGHEKRSWIDGQEIFPTTL